MAMTPAERKRQQRERDKLSEEERKARLLSRKIVTELYHKDDAALRRVMSRVGIEEEQDLISRLIRGADRMAQDDLESLVKL